MKRTDFMENKPVPPTITFDGQFQWANDVNRITSTCHLTVYSLKGTKFIVAKEISANKGMSITNAAESLWINVILKFGEAVAFETHDGERYDLVNTGKITYVQEFNGTLKTSGDVTWDAVGDWDSVLRRVKDEN